MDVSAEIRKKLAILIGDLICRCISEARMIPHVLNRDEVINLLFDNPNLFEKLVHDEHSGQTELSKEDLTVNVDVVRELGQLDKLESSEQSIWEGPEIDLSPILDSINQLTRTYAVYLGNAATLFDKAFEDFMEKFRQSMQRAGMTLKTVDFTISDAEAFGNNALSYLSSGDFLQAFTFDRLLSSQIMMKQVVNLPSAGFSLRDDLINHALNDSELCAPLIKFLLRITYISQGSWDDLFQLLVKHLSTDPGKGSISMLLDLIEQDVVFSCNLLCSSYIEIRQWSSSQRRTALESSILRNKNADGPFKLA
jgi:hypothetical protein